MATYPLTTVELFLVAMALILFLPWALWRRLRTDSWAPLVVVQIVMGIVLGPGLLGQALPEFHRALFTPAVVQTLNGLAWWGVMLFVWLAGIELDLRQAWRERRDSGISAALALGVPLLAGSIAGAALLASGDGWTGPAARPWRFVLGVGMACAATALPILILFLDKLGILRQPLGHHVLLVLMLVFFLSTGLRTQWTLGGSAVFFAAFGLLAAAVGGKLLGVGLAGRWLGWPRGEALPIGWLLQTKALIMIVFANILLDKAVISADTFTALLLMAVMSTMLTIPQVAPRLARLQALMEKAR